MDDHGALAKMEQTHQSYTSKYNGFMNYDQFIEKFTNFSKYEGNK